MFNYLRFFWVFFLLERVNSYNAFKIETSRVKTHSHGAPPKAYKVESRFDR